MNKVFKKYQNLYKIILQYRSDILYLGDGGLYFKVYKPH